MVLAGFYSNGEISPFAVGQPSRLHNQTMTITTLREITQTALKSAGQACKTRCYASSGAPWALPTNHPATGAGRL
jgi:hypothetical protein